MENEYYYVATCVMSDGTRKRKKFLIPIGNDGFLDSDGSYEKAEAWLDSHKDSIEGSIAIGHRRVRK